MSRKVPLGRGVTTPNAREQLDAGRMLECLARHARADWGDAIAPGDRRVNDRALRDGARVMSVWWVDPNDPPAGKFWIITEADRASTCVLMPEDY